MALHLADAGASLAGRASEGRGTLAPPSQGRGLRALDDLARDPDARGFVVVRAAAGVLHALRRHVQRRARAIGRALVDVDGLWTDDPWRELCGRVLPQPLEADAAEAARALIERAGDALLVVREGAPTHFGRALASELAASASEGAMRALVLVFVEHAPGRNDAGEPALRESSLSGARVLDVDGALAAEDLRTWWEAVASDGGHAAERLDALESWWAAAKLAPPSERAALPALGPEAERLLARIALARRSWPVALLGRLGTAEAAQELVAAGVLALDARGHLVAGPTAAPFPEPEADDARVVAAALDAIVDPWAAARASELHAAAGAIACAEASAVRAIGAVADPVARADLWSRWSRTLATLAEADAVPPLLRAVDLALRAGDVERAVELGTQALAKRPDGFGTLLALGRTNLARGDLPTASHWLGKARAVAEESGIAEARAMVEVELAELRHMEGDMDAAGRHASAVASLSAEPATLLSARNVLGKILLAQKAWSEAEAHFAADACDAIVAGDLTGELRARLNRAIAVFSAGRLDDARAMLATVLDEGDARGEVRAVAYALTNLASIATMKREYVEALRLSERAFEARRRLGDKVTLALLITNMAELKLQLGMVAEAEQALAFGRQACGPAMPGSRASHFAITAALIHLARGRTVEARAELKTALATAGGSPHGARLGECWRLAARIELEDGDRVAARVAIEHAARAAESARERAQVALYRAHLARANGERFGDAAEEALERARESGDPEICRDAHVLLHHAAGLDGDARAARAHLEIAVSLRDQIADRLPEQMRARFLARRDLAEIDRLALVRLAAPADVRGPEVDAPPSRSGGLSRSPSDVPPPPRSSAGRIEIVPALKRMVGRTPAMLALAGAVAKVGKSDATVLVHGESGTGKELVAEAIHEASVRRDGPLVKVNCAALVETLLLSELFGHEKGSFTGAAARRRGRFEVADGGTLFLDEIGDISPRTQVALLRVLQDKTFERVGGVTPIRADVRIVCATHRDLPAMVARGEFREDLYYRLRGVVLEVPALRQRIPDLPLVAASILERIAAERGTRVKRLSDLALAGLARHRWPGNVRELENALRAAALFADNDAIELEDFTTNVDGLASLGAEGTAPQSPGEEPIRPASSASLGPVSAVSPTTLTSRALARNREEYADGTDAAWNDGTMSQPSKFAPIGSGEGGTATEVAYAAIRAGVSLSDLKRDIERDCIARALAETGGNITRAASLLGMKRPRLSQLVKQYGFGSSAGSANDADGDAEDEE